MNQELKADLKAVHWKFGDDKVNYESQNGSMMSEARDQVVRAAIRARKEPESLQLGKMLRKSHIQFSHRPDREFARTEAKMRFVPQKIEVSEGFGDSNGAELRATHIDLAVAGNKSGKEWESVLKSTMSASEDVKFACSKPQGFAELGEELRKSSVLLHAGRHDFRSQTIPVNRSESTRQYCPQPISQTKGFADTLGKELRTSSLDLAAGVPKTGSHWQSQQHAIMAGHNDKKWACKRQEGFDNLIAELRKTNITLGTDRVVYGTEGAKRPIRDDRNRHPAGHVPGL